MAENDSVPQVVAKFCSELSFLSSITIYYISCRITFMFLQYYVRLLCATLNTSHYFFSRMLTATEKNMYFD